MSLFDQQDLAEISHPSYPGERLAACSNPVLAADRARKREELPAATERPLAPIITHVPAGRLTGAAEIGVAVGSHLPFPAQNGRHHRGIRAHTFERGEVTGLSDPGGGLC